MKPFSNERGSVVVWTLLIIAILSLLGAEVLRVVTAKYQNALHAATWQEALLGAESGVDLAAIELRKSLLPAPNHAWDNWNNVPGDKVTSYGLTTIPNAGMSASPMTVEIYVDAPASLVDPQNGWQYYRVRSTGTLPLNGPPRVTDNAIDTQLRRVSLQWERFTNGVIAPRPLAAPQSSRRVEAILRPVSSFDAAIMAVGLVDLNNQSIVVDSYDSRDPAKSTNGLYDVAKRQQNGDVATDGQLIDAGNAHIYGDVATNAGTVSGAANVTGIERTDFYQDPIPVGAPTWFPVNNSVTTVNGTMAMSASSTKGSSSSRYVLSSINLGGSQTLTLAGNPDGSTTYIDIYVTGNISVSGNAQIVLQPGVKATIYFGANVDIAGNGIINSNNQPGDMQLYGIQPDSGSTPHVNLGGNGQISAAVYAPGHAVAINGGGTNGHVYGSVVGSTVSMTGVTNLHYDEALGSGGLIAGYKIVSWLEDTR